MKKQKIPQTSYLTNKMNIQMFYNNYGIYGNYLQFEILLINFYFYFFHRWYLHSKLKSLNFQNFPSAKIWKNTLKIFCYNNYRKFCEPRETTDRNVTGFRKRKIRLLNYQDYCVLLINFKKLYKKARAVIQSQKF